MSARRYRSPIDESKRQAVRVKRLGDAQGFAYCRRCLNRPVWFVDSGLPTGRSIRVYCDRHLPVKHRPAADAAI